MTRFRTVLVRGVGDVGSAVAHVLFGAGHAVALHDGPAPATTRRGMAFADAVFDGQATLDGVAARRIDVLADLPRALADRAFVPVATAPLAAVLAACVWEVLVDARLRKRDRPEPQRGLAPLAIGLGPGFVAGESVDLAVETSWDRLGELVRAGPTLPLAGEPRPIAGIGRERFVYAPVDGVFRTTAQIGRIVEAGAVVATVDGAPLAAPVPGALRGLTRDGVPVAHGAKVIEIDPRGPRAVVAGLGERPRRLAEAVRIALEAPAAASPSVRPG